MNKKGFTLVELLATLVVLGIVVGISLVSMNGIFKNSKKKSEDVFVGTIKDAMDIYLSSSDAKNLNFSIECSNTLEKTFGDRKVFKTNINFEDVINSQYKPITQAELVNPANEDVTCALAQNIGVSIYRDEDYVYYYKIDKNEFGCLLNVSTSDGTTIDNLPEGFGC